jgi:Arc/MetJ family transcription regulator
MRCTTIDVDDELVSRAMATFGLPTKRAAVDLALRRMLGAPLTGGALAEYLLSFEGTGGHGELADLRSDEVTGVG